MHKKIYVNRNQTIDILRCLGLLLIILAHTSPPVAISQFRNFDVPLMVIVSAFSFLESYKQESYYEYFVKRFKRLVLPVWGFLTAYFLIEFTTGIFHEPLSLKTMIGSYTLTTGIGYVWIIGVFMAVALAAPEIYKMNKSLSDAKYITLLMLTYVAYELCCWVISHYTEIIYIKTFHKIFMCFIGYIMIFSLAIRLPQLKIEWIYSIIIIAILTFTILAIYLYSDSGNFVLTQDYKYPPTLYYISYAIMMSLIAWLIAKKLVFTGHINDFIIFASKNSIWIYLWHIPIIKLLSVHGYLSIYSYPLILMITSMMVVIQNKIDYVFKRQL